MSTIILPGGNLPGSLFAKVCAGGVYFALNLSYRAAMIPKVVFSFALLAVLVGVESAALAAVGFTRGPFVQNATSNSIQVIWRTSAEGNSLVEYGPTEALGMIASSAVAETFHVVTLGDLDAGRTYFYRVRSECAAATVTSGVERFRTLKMAGPVSFGVLSDTAVGNLTTFQLGAALYRQDPDLVLVSGDVVADSYDREAAGFQFFGVFERLVRRTPFYLVPGNHDTTPGFGGDLEGQNFQNAFFLPTNSATGSELFYSFDHGDVHFVGLFNPWFMAYVFSLGDAQYAWLTNDLAASTKPWKLIYMHQGIASSSFHGHQDLDGNGLADQTDLMNLLLPVAEQYGVQVVFSGHDHVYERFAPTNGVYPITAGGGGQSGPYWMSGPQAASVQLWAAFHCLMVTVTNDTLSLRALDTNGVVFDAMTIQKSLPPRQMYQSAWNSPRICSAPADDGDGNIVGQSFDFAGIPILPQSGRFSNLGRVFVNNDATYLYLGLDQVMLYPNNNAFLFVESPRQAGVTTMTGVGDGVLDPTGQGADGLDCLENLSFRNFAPSIGCIVGDEYGDGQFRSFVRSNLALNIGQGVFRLDSGLSDVPGACLQQYNRSPQVFPLSTADSILYEQSADFIQIAIPFRELGGLQPGDTIKIGAIFGGAAFDPVAQTRDIDTAALASSLTGTGQGAVILEGVGVRLAAEPLRPVLSIVTAPSGQYLLSWSAEVGSKYDIEVSSDLVSFSRLTTAGLPVTATSSNQTFLVEAPAGTTGFYRVRVVP